MPDVSIAFLLSVVYGRDNCCWGGKKARKNETENFQPFLPNFKALIDRPSYYKSHLVNYYLNLRW